MTDTLTIQLNPALTVGERKITELRLREPLAKEVRQAEEKLGAGNGSLSMSRDYQTKLLVLVCGHKEAELEGISMSDFFTAARFLDAFVHPKRKPNAGGGAADDEADDVPEDAPDKAGLRIELPEPIDAAGHQVSELELAELTLAQMREAEKVLTDYSPAKVRAYQVFIVALAAGVPRAVIDNLPVRVLNRAAAFVQGFSGGAQPTASS